MRRVRQWACCPRTWDDYRKVCAVITENRPALPQSPLTRRREESLCRPGERDNHFRETLQEPIYLLSKIRLTVRPWTRSTEGRHEDPEYLRRLTVRVPEVPEWQLTESLD